MKINTLKNAIFTLLLTTIIPAHAADTGFKMAIIEDTFKDAEIDSENYETSISRLRSAKISPLEKDMGLCVAYMKTSSFEKAAVSCDSAIITLESMSTKSSHNRYLKALSYSNRAVVRYIQNDRLGAIDDLTTAILIDNNNIVKHNLNHIKSTTLLAKTSGVMSPVL